MLLFIQVIAIWTPLIKLCKAFPENYSFETTILKLRVGGMLSKKILRTPFQFYKVCLRVFSALQVDDN